MKATRFASLLLMLVSMACSSGGGGGGSPAAPGGTGPDNADKQRWTEEGEYSTTLTYNGCTNSYNYPNQAEYCVALLNEALDQCGAQESRKRAYEDSCGTDFEPRNLLGPMVDGYDRDLKKDCSIDGNRRFPRVADLCAFLRDESQHQGCFWSHRRSWFTEYSCPGDFPPRPAQPSVPDPQPSPSPQPGPTPAQNPQPQSRFDRLVQDYAAVGIELEVDRQGSANQFTFPGDEPFDVQLAKLIPVLERTKLDFANRRSSIQGISISRYTAYSESSRSLSLNVGTASAELIGYLSLHDQRMALQEATGIVIDFGVEIFGHGAGDRLAGFRENIRFFSARRAELKALRPLITSIELTNLNYMSFFSKTYKLDRDLFKEQFSRDLPLLNRLGTIAAKGIEFKGYLDIDESRPALEAFANLSVRHLDELSALGASLNGLSFELKGSYDAAPRFYSSLKQVSVGLKSSFAGADGLAAMYSVAPLMQELGAEIEVTGNDLDQAFIAGTKLLLNSRTKLRLKRHGIAKIALWSSETQYYPSLKQLAIKMDDSLSNLHRVIDSIQ